VAERIAGLILALVITLSINPAYADVRLAQAAQLSQQAFTLYQQKRYAEAEPFLLEPILTR
jgi:hypothetical protein